MQITCNVKHTVTKLVLSSTPSLINFIYDFPFQCLKLEAYFEYYRKFFKSQYVSFGSMFNLSGKKVFYI